LQYRFAQNKFLGAIRCSDLKTRSLETFYGQAPLTWELKVFPWWLLEGLRRRHGPGALLKNGRAAAAPATKLDHPADLPEPLDLA
jgi:hypothetical protein